jgi:ABC-2 type transport system permease protein
MYRFKGSFQLIRFILRRDRLYLPLWIIGLVTLAVFFVPMMPDMVGDEASRQALVATMKNPAMVAMMGPAFAENFTLGALYTQFMLVWVTLGCAVFNIMFVVRHTRFDEEAGRLEMLTALPIGRSANLLATLLLVLAVDLLIGLLVLAIMPAFGVETIGISGSATYAFVLSACGWTFAGLTALVSQLSSRARGALGLSLALLGVAYLLRAMGDVGTEVLSWISPLGMATRAEAFVSNLPAPIGLLFAEGLLFAAAASGLQAMRDHGAGLLPQRSGRSRASVLLRGEWTLVWREVRGTVLAWVVVCFALSAAYGSVMGEMNAFIENNAVYQAFMGVGPGTKDITGPVVSMLILIMSMIAAIPVIVVVNRLVSEERRGRMEQLLAAVGSRVYLFAGYFVVALVVALLMQLANAVGFWMAAASSLGIADALSLAEVMRMAFSYLPAVVAFGGLAALLVGAAPRLTALSWVYLAYAFFVLYVGRTMNLPDWLAKTSPFGLLPSYPVDAFEPGLATAIVGASLALACVGAFVYRFRDIKG